MCNHFREVFSLCQFVLEDSRNEKLISCTLETLLRFLNWIPLGYIFETGLINALVFKVCLAVCLSFATNLTGTLLF